MTKRVWWLTAVLTLLLAVAGCGGGDDDGGAAQGTGGTEDTGAEGGAKPGGILAHRDDRRLRLASTRSPPSARSRTPPSSTSIRSWSSTTRTSSGRATGRRAGRRRPTGWTWTFKLKPGGEWSDGTPLTAEDAVWTGETILKYKKGPTAEPGALPLARRRASRLPDPNTLVITYARPVGNVLPQLQQFFILPKHVWEKYAVGDGKALKQYLPEKDLPIVSGGQFVLTKYDKKGTTILERNPGFYGTPPNPDAVGIQWFANSDAMLTAFTSGELDLDQRAAHGGERRRGQPSLRRDRDRGLPDQQLHLQLEPATSRRTASSSTPRCREAFSHAMNREEMIEVVYGGHADPVASIVIPTAGEWMNPNLEPEAVRHRRSPTRSSTTSATSAGRTGSASCRRRPASRQRAPMSYEIITPDSLDGINRAFEIVRTGLAEIGVEVTPELARLDDRLRGDRRAATGSTRTSTSPCGTGSATSTRTSSSPSSLATSGAGWSDTGYCNPEYDKLYEEQGGTADQEARKEIVWEMQDILYRDKPYIQLVVLDTITAHSTKWAGFLPGSLDRIHEGVQRRRRTRWSERQLADVASVTP